MRPRRFLPSVTQLLAFEAVMRHKTVTSAAGELNLTQSTVSRLVNNLEHQLGQALFVRERKRLHPTDAALAYSRNVTQALDIIQRASMSLVANPGGGSLSLAVLPIFGTRWLSPRLGQFLDTNPGISMTLATRIQRFSFEHEAFDAVIFFGEADWAGANHSRLFEEHITACASPAFLERHPVSDASDLAGLPLLQLESRPNAWNVWFRAQGAAMPKTSGMLMDQFSMMIQAAISGLGIALLPDYLARTEIEEGRLAPILRTGVPGTGSYWLAWPKVKDDYQPLRAFRDWIVRCAEGGKPSHPDL
ncbi:LysR family transcriptional regulator [Oricola thermophila]|uniref:LysR family transcriptional regulator n=1 Tax=Oricola thermophila TaxID=2742145 RepID=A0A6N1VGY4_9HYPH|nr:LysR family transcriptional regulator [Oricola thermophila]QKV20171.1 LysR family transcriptional regulator [Oricola thermophila]